MVCLPKSGLNLRWSHARKKEQGGRQSDEGQRASIRPQKPCAAAEFAKQFGFTDIMPALCNVDFASMELLHAKLIRATTCVDGCRCDYTICGDKDPYLKGHPEYRDEAGFRRNR